MRLGSLNILDEFIRRQILLISYNCADNGDNRELLYRTIKISAKLLQALKLKLNGVKSNFEPAFYQL